MKGHRKTHCAKYLATPEGQAAETAWQDKKKVNKESRGKKKAATGATSTTSPTTALASTPVATAHQYRQLWFLQWQTCSERVSMEGYYHWKISATWFRSLCIWGC